MAQEPEQQEKYQSFIGASSPEPGSYLDYAKQIVGEVPWEEQSYVQYAQNLLGVPAAAAAPAAPAVPPVVRAPGGKAIDPNQPEPTVLDFVLGAGESFMSNFSSSMRAPGEYAARVAHDFALNHNIPVWQGDDVYRAEIEKVAKDQFNGDVGKAQDWAWNTYGKQKTAELRRTGMGIGIPLIGKYVDDAMTYAETTMAENLRRRSPAVQEGFATELSGFLGGSAPYFLLGLIPGAQGAAVEGVAARAGAAAATEAAGAFTARNVAIGAMAGMSQANDAYTRARAEGASFGDALVGSMIAATPAALTAGMSTQFLLGQKTASTTLVKLADRWNKMSGGRYAKMFDSVMSNVMGRIAVAGTVEGGQEILEQLFVEFGVAYATDQDLLEMKNIADNLIQAGKGGAEVGMFVRSLTEMVIGRRARYSSAGTKPDPNVRVGDKEIFDPKTGELAKVPTQITPEMAVAMERERVGPFAGAPGKNIVDRYYDEALNRPEQLPTDIPVNELATIIAAEEKVDIGVATVAAEAVRARLDQGKIDPTKPPDIRDYTTIQVNDPKTWPSNVTSEEQAQQYKTQAWKKFHDDYRRWEELTRTTPEKEAEARVERLFGGPETEAAIKGRRKELRSLIAERVERRRLDAARTVGDSYRKHQAELREAELLAQATEQAAQEAGGTPMQRDVARKLRELTQTYQEKLEQERAYLAEQYQINEEGLRKHLAEREKLSAQEEKDQMQRLSEESRRFGEELASRIEATRQAFLEQVAKLTEPESATGKERSAEWKAYIERMNAETKRTEKIREGTIAWQEAQTADFREALDVLYGDQPQRKEVRDQLKKHYEALEVEAQRRIKGVQAEIDRRKTEAERAQMEAEELQALLLPQAETKEREEFRAKLRKQIQSEYKQKAGAPAATEEQLALEEQVAAAAPELVAARDAAIERATHEGEIVRQLDKRIAEVDSQLEAARAGRNKEELQALRESRMELVMQREASQQARLDAEEEARVLRNQLQTLEAPAAAPASASPTAVEPVAQPGVANPKPAVKSKFLLTDEQAGVILARSVPEIYGRAKQGYQNSLRRVLQMISEPGQSVTVDSLIGQIKPKDLNADQRRTYVLGILTELKNAGLVHDIQGDNKITYHISADLDQQIRKLQPQPEPAAAPEAAPPAGFARPKTAKEAEIPKAGQPAKVGEVVPGMSAYEARLKNALGTNPLVENLEFVAPEVKQQFGAAYQDTASQIQQASDQDLRSLLNSDKPLGLEPKADQVVTDPKTGITRVVTTKPGVVELDPKSTSTASWIAHRTLAFGELRRRAAIAARAQDARTNETATAAVKANPAKYGKPRLSYDVVRTAGEPLGMNNGQPIVDFQDAPGYEGASLTGTLEPSLVNPPTKPVSKLDLRQALMDVANVVAAPLVQMNMSGKPFIGMYDPNNNVLRVSSTFNFHVVGHEIGHSLVARLFGSGEAGPKALDAVMPADVRAEMDKLGRLVYGDTVPHGGYLHEGVAELTTGYLLRPEAYSTAFPKAFAWLQTTLDSDPQLGQAMARAQDVFHVYRFQGSIKTQEAASIDKRNVSEQMVGVREQVADVLGRAIKKMRLLFTTSYLEREFVNQIVAARKMDQRIRKALENPENLRRLTEAGIDAGKLQSVQSYTEALIAKNGQLLNTWMNVAMTDGDGNIIPGSMSLDQALAPMRAAAKRIPGSNVQKDFASYCQAKREIALYDSGRISTSAAGIVPQRDSVAKHEAKYGDAIKLAHGNLMAWWSQAIEYVKANDPSLREVFETIERVERELSTEGTYVPLQRVIYDVITGNTADAGLADVFDVRRAGERVEGVGSRATRGPVEGSAAPALNVLQESQASLQALLTLAHKRMMIRNAVNFAQLFSLRGDITEITEIDGSVPEPMLTSTGRRGIELVSLGDRSSVLGVSLMSASEDINADGRVMLDYVDMVPNPAGEPKLDSDGNPVIGPDGQPVVRLDPIRRRFNMSEDWAIAFASLNPSEARSGIQSWWILKKLSQTFKLGATGLNMGFQLVSAPIMDMGTTFLNGSQPWYGFRVPLDYAYTYARLGLAEAKLLQYEPYEQYKRLAAGFDQPWSATTSKASIEYLLSSKSERRKRLLQVWNGDLVSLLERKVSFGSRTGRVMEMRQSLKASGWDGKSPLTQLQATNALVASRRVTTNWSVAGNTAKEVNRIVPYFNVTFVTFRDYMRSAAKQLSDPRTRLQYIVKMGTLVGMTMAYWKMVNDDDEPEMKEAYKNASYDERMRYWIFGYKTDEGTTEVVRIPNPMTEFIVPKMMLAALDGTTSSDPYAAGNWTKAVLSSFLPSLPGYVAAPIEAGANVNDLNKAFLDMGFEAAGIPSTKSAGPLESAYGKGPKQERVTPYTSMAGAAVSDAINGALSPRQVDQLIEGFVAGTPDQLASLLRIEGPMTPEVVKQAPGYGMAVTEFTVGRLVSKTGPITMRSPKIQELGALLEAAQRRKDSTREPETLQMAAELQALKDAWGCVSALNYISQYHPDMTRLQRQNLMRTALTIASDMTSKIQAGVGALEYKTYDSSSRVLKEAASTLRERQTAQRPGTYPSIDFSKILR